MKNLPFFSVIVPVYNKEKYVSRAIESVLNQTYTLFELIIVCDPSSDNSELEIAKFNDCRIRVFHRKEPGPGGYAARNLGIKHSVARWICFLDADDVWCPTHLEKSRNAIGANLEIDLGIFNSIQIDGVHKIKRFNMPYESILDNYKLIELFAKEDIIHTNSIFVKKNKIEAAGLFPEGKAMRGGDSDLWLRLLMVSNKCYISNEVTSLYYLENSGVIKNYRTADHIHPLTVSVGKFLEESVDSFLGNVLKKLSNRKSISLYLVRKRFGTFRYQDLKNIYYKNLGPVEWLKLMVLVLPSFVSRNIKPLKGASSTNTADSGTKCNKDQPV